MHKEECEAMTDNLLEESPAAADDDGRTADVDDIGGAPVRPDIIPEKFWDAGAGEVRVDALAKSYAELERKLGSSPARDVPESADGYAIDTDDRLVGADPAVNARLHAAGFTQDQAQLVYDLAGEYLPGMVGEVVAEFEARNQVERLERHYGGADRWRETARQLATWGRAKLPPDVFHALSGTYEGVLALDGMMRNGEPGLGGGGDGAPAGASEADLKEMMRDPRYWREREPLFVEKVRDGFRKLFPGAG